MNADPRGILTAQDYLRHLAQGEVTGRFRGVGHDDFVAWRDDLRERLLGLFRAYGYSGDRSAASLCVVDECDWHGVRRVEVRFENADYGLVVPATVLQPPKEASRGAGIVCQHGHGDWGRRAVIGDRTQPEVAAEIDRFQYDFGLRFAQEGYTVVAIDLLGFGERTEPRNRGSGRDPCDLLGLFMLLYGRNLVVEQVSAIQRSITLLSDWPGVDAGRIGIAGLSQGGRMTMFTSALDERIQVAVVSGSHNTFRDRVGGLVGLCGAQIVPGIMPRADTPDLLASIAPRPLQLQWGLQDSLIVHGPAREGIVQIERCYRAAGAADRFQVDTFEGGHVFHLDPALAWFEKWL